MINKIILNTLQIITNLIFYLYFIIIKMPHNRHKSFTIHNWKRRGLICDDYNKLYEKVMNTEKCEKCSIHFSDNPKSKRCMDHDHKTGLFRYTLCNSCNSQYDKPLQNNKIGFTYLCYNRSGDMLYICYNRRGFKKKNFKTLTEALAYSFLMIFKK